MCAQITWFFCALQKKNDILHKNIQESLKERSPFLKELEIKVMEREQCNKLLISESNFCGQAVEDFEDILCPGDSGGHLVAKVGLNMIITLIYKCDNKN